MTRAALVLLTLAALCSPAAADPASDLAQRVLDYLYPHRVKRLPVPLPPSRPVEIAPVTEPLPTATLEPKEVMPDQPVTGPHKAQPASADQERPARADPPMPSVMPTPSPPRQADRTFRKEERRRAPKQVRQPSTPAENDGSWLAPCWMVCSHVKGKCKAQLAADEAYWKVTAYQKAHGKRCIASTCPGTLGKC